jgi:glutathione S-transferase
MLLVGQFDSPFVRRVAVALNHHGLSFEHRPWSVWGQADDIARLNPLRRVPVLVLEGGDAPGVVGRQVLVESAAILDAIDDIAPSGAGALISRDPVVRRETLRVCAFAMGMADKAVSLLYEHLLRAGEQKSPLWVDRCRAQISETLDLLEAERAGTTASAWFGTLSHADIAVACALRFLGEAHPDLWAEARRPALHAHARWCEDMDIFARVVQPLKVVIAGRVQGA